jgi:hypothetical protein
MLNITEAIYELYPQVVSTVDDTAYDANGNQVAYDLAAVTEQAQKNNCKQQASQLLYETDWTTIPDVANPANSPYLTNQAAFIAWRSQIRALAVNPIVDPVFSPKPDEVWG